MFQGVIHRVEHIELNRRWSCQQLFRIDFVHGRIEDARTDENRFARFRAQQTRMSQKSATGETIRRIRLRVLQKGVVNVGTDDVHLRIVADEVHLLDFRLIFASSDLVRHHFGVLKGNFVRFADQGRVFQIVAAQFLRETEKNKKYFLRANSFLSTYLIQRFETCEKCAMSESWQISIGFEYQIFVAGDHWNVTGSVGKIRRDTWIAVSEKNVRDDL